MSVIVQSKPEAYGLAYNDNPYVFFSTNYTPTSRFKVVILPSTFPTDPALATVRVYPRVGVTNGGTVQLNKAYYDPSRILQTQIQTKVEIPTANHPVGFAAPEMHSDYGLFIQEEDKVNGVYVGGDSVTTEVKSVWNGVRNKVDWLDFDYTDYDMSAGNDRKFLTDAPSVQYINSNKSAFLTFLATQSDVVSARFQFYDATGATLGTGDVDLSALTSAYAYIACGTYDIANSDPTAWSGVNPATILTSCSYYQISLRTGSNSSETFTFYIDSKCSKYTPIRLHWLNRLGGFDSYNFNMKSMEETDIKRANYLQEEHRFTGTTWEYNSASRGRTDYHISTQDKLTVNTDYMTEAESIWMNDLFTSPVVYQEVNNQLIAMSGKPKMIKKQTSLNDKLMQYEFEMDYALTNNRQRG